MRKLSNLAMVCCTAITMLVFSGTSMAEGGNASASIANGKNIFENGKADGTVAACSSCHGDKAMGNDGMGTPRLSHLGYAYIVKQLTNFAEDKRTDMTLGVMNGFAKALTAQEKRDVAAYVNTIEKSDEVSDLAALKADGKAVGESYKGQIIVKYGVEGKVSACQSCHGYNGRGADPVYPKIGQQKFVYLVNQLTHWRDSSRANDPMGQMQKVAKGLTDEDINNVATYLSQAPESTIGDGMEIENQSVLKNVKIVK